MVRLILGKNRIDRLFELDSNSRILPRDDDFPETYFFRIEGKKNLHGKFNTLPRLKFNLCSARDS